MCTRSQYNSLSLASESQGSRKPHAHRLPPPGPALLWSTENLLCFQDGTSLVSVNVPYRPHHPATSSGLFTALCYVMSSELMRWWFTWSVSQCWTLRTPQIHPNPHTHYQEAVLWSVWLLFQTDKRGWGRRGSERNKLLYAGLPAVRCENVLERRISGFREQAACKSQPSPLLALDLGALISLISKTRGLKAVSLEMTHAKCFELCKLQADMLFI